MTETFHLPYIKIMWPKMPSWWVVSFQTLAVAQNTRKLQILSLTQMHHNIIAIVDKMESDDFVLTSARRWPVYTFTLCLIRWQWMLSWCTGLLLVKILPCENSPNSLQRSLTLRRMYSVVAYQLLVIFNKYMVWLGGWFCRICLLSLIYQCN
jgi:hypothetical protein